MFLCRLSAIAGDPDIMELSDPNRPMKIAEKFTEMYDNDWADSMDALEDLKIPEKKCVEILLHFVTVGCRYIYINRFFVFF